MEIREVGAGELGREVLDRVKEDLGDLAKVEQHPSFETGRQMSMVMASEMLATTVFPNLILTRSHLR